MKRSYPKDDEPSSFRLALANESEMDVLLAKQVDLSRQEIYSKTDEEVVRHLVQYKPREFLRYLLTEPADEELREKLEKIPQLYYNLFKYCCVNDYLLCNEMSQAYLLHWNVFKDLQLRSSRLETSTRRYEDLCLLFTLNPSKYTALIDDSLLNHASASNIVQYYGQRKDLYSTFFLYEHAEVMEECRTNPTVAQELATMHSLLYPFGCPHAAYYTTLHHKLRLIALDIVKVFAISSLEVLKEESRQDPTRCNALRYANTILSLFINEVYKAVAINKKLFDTGLHDLHLTEINNDEDYGKMLLKLMATRSSFKSLFVPIDTTWLINFIQNHVQPLMSRKDHHNNYIKRFNAPVRLISALNRLNESYKDEIGLLRYQHISARMSTASIMDQVKHEQRVKKRSPSPPIKREPIQSRVDLLDAVKVFISDEENRNDPARPHAFLLYDELRLADKRDAARNKVEETALSFMDASSSSGSAISEATKLEHLYMLLCIQSCKEQQ